MLACLLFLLLLTDVLAVDGDSSELNCSYVDLLNHLKLTHNKEMHLMTRPVKNHRNITEVTLDVLLYAILDVDEKGQQIVPYLWIDMWWTSEHISWDPADFCGIVNFSIPTDLLWKPDITLGEMTQRDKATPAPYLTVNSNGEVVLSSDQVLFSSCRMHVYKFPFDIQTCNLTFTSVIYSVDEVRLVQHLNSSKITELSNELMLTQYEWLFISMTVHQEDVNFFGLIQSQIIYTVNIKRRSGLYILNFMLPILFFLCLDFASFVISDSGDEKLGFKVTVLLAVTVLQLILNDILPTSSERIPLIAVYCIGIFTMMMISLLETMFVRYLLAKDAESPDDEDAKPQSLNEGKQGVKDLIGCSCVHGVTTDENPSQLLPANREGSCSQLTHEPQDFDKSSDELREVVKALALLLDSKKEGRKPGYWTRTTKTINIVFFACYVLATTLFLFYMMCKWSY